MNVRMKFSLQKVNCFPLTLLHQSLTLLSQSNVKINHLLLPPPVQQNELVLSIMLKNASIHPDGRITLGAYLWMPSALEFIPKYVVDYSKVCSAVLKEPQ